MSRIESLHRDKDRLHAETDKLGDDTENAGSELQETQRIVEQISEENFQAESGSQAQDLNGSLSPGVKEGGGKS